MDDQNLTCRGNQQQPIEEKRNPSLKKVDVNKFTKNYFFKSFFCLTREGGDQKEGKWRYRGGCKDVDQVSRHH